MILAFDLSIRMPACVRLAKSGDLSADVLTTERTSRKAQDDIRRFRAVRDWILEQFKTCGFERVEAVCAEHPATGRVRDYRAAVSQYGALGLFLGIEALYGIETTWLHQRSVKLALTGKANATKAEVVRMARRWPEARRMIENRRRKDEQEAIADAFGVLISCTGVRRTL